MNRKNNSPNPGLGTGSRTGLRSQAAQSAAGSSSLFGLISKVNQGILKEPAKPKGILKNANQGSAVVPTTTVPTSASQTTAVKQKQDVFLEAKNMIEQIQKGLWKPSEQSSPATSSSNTKQDTVFKVPMAIPTIKPTKRTAQKKAGKVHPKLSTPGVSEALSKPETSSKEVADSKQDAAGKNKAEDVMPAMINLVDYDDDDESVSDAGERSSVKYTENKALKELDMYTARKREDQDMDDSSKRDKRSDKEYDRRNDSDEERSYRPRSRSFSPERSRSKDYSPEPGRYRESERYSRSGYRDSRSPSPDVYIGNLSPPMDMSRYSRYSTYHSTGTMGYSSGATGHPYKPGYDSYGVQSMYDRSAQMGGYYSNSGSYRGGSPPYYGSPYQSGVRASSPGFDARNYSSTAYGSRSTVSSYESQRSYDPHYSQSYRQTEYDRGMDRGYTDERRKEYEREYERAYSNRGSEQKYSDYRYDNKEYSRSGDEYKSRYTDTRRDSPDYRERDRDRDRERDRDRDRERDGDRDRERDGDRDRERDRDIDSERKKERDSERERRRDNEQYREKDSERERIRYSEQDRERDSKRERDHTEKRGRSRRRDRGRNKDEPGNDSTKERSKISFAIMGKSGVSGQTIDRLEDFDDSSSLESVDGNEGEPEKAEKSPDFVRWDEFDDEADASKEKAKGTEEKKKSNKDELYEDYLFSDRYMKDDDEESIIGVSKKAGIKNASSDKAGAKTGAQKPAVGYRCEDCDVTCTDKAVYEIHLLGVKHSLAQQKKSDEENTRSTGRKSRFETDATGKPVVVGGIQPPGVAAIVPASITSAVSHPTILPAGPRPGLIQPAVSLPGVPRPDFSKPPPSLNVPRPDFTKPPPALSVSAKPPPTLPVGTQQPPTLPVSTKQPPTLPVGTIQPPTLPVGTKPLSTLPLGTRPSVRHPLLPTPDFTRPPPAQSGPARPGPNAPAIPPPGFTGPPPAVRSAFPTPGFVQATVPRPGLIQRVVSQQTVPQQVISQQIGPRPSISHQIGQQPVISQQIGQQPVISQQIGQQPVISQHTGPKPMISQQIVSKPIISQQTGPQPIISQQTGPQPTIPQQTGPRPVISQQSVQHSLISQATVSQPVISQKSILQPVIPQLSGPKPAISQQAMPPPLMSLTVPRPVISQQSVPQPGLSRQIIPQQHVPLPIVSQQAGLMLSSNLPTGTQQPNTQSGNEAGRRITRFDEDEEPRMNEDTYQNYRSNSRYGIQVTIPKPLGPLQATRIQARCVTLIWEYLSEEEEEMIDRYVVEYRNARETHWVTVADTNDHEYVVDGLQEKTDYLFRVVAMCGSEKSEYLESILITTAARGSSSRRRSRDRDTNLSRQSDQTRSYGRRRSRSKSPERRRSKSPERKRSRPAEGQRSRSAERRRSLSPERQKTRITRRDEPAEKRKVQVMSKNNSKETMDKIDKKPDLDTSVLEIKLKAYTEKEFSKSKLGSKVGHKSGSKQKVECEFYKLFKRYPEEPMLGLGYIYETQSYNPLIPPYYKCKLCKQNGSGEIMIRHVIGFAHRMAIIKMRNPVLSESIGMLYARKQKITKVLKESMIIEDNIGRESVNVMRMLNPEDHDGKVIFEEPVPVPAPPTTRPKYEEPEENEEPDPQDSEFMKLYNAAVEAEALPDKSIIGLKYVQELIHPDNSELPLYRCNLCKCLLRHGTILFHLIGKKHRIQYLKKHYPTQVESSKNAKFKKDLRDLAAEIEQKEGIGAVQITKCKNTRAWNQKNKHSNDQFTNQTNQESTDTPKKSQDSNKGIKFGLLKTPEEQSTAINPTNALEEETKQSSKEILDWTAENEILQTKIQNQSIIKSSRKSRFMNVYGPVMKKYSVVEFPDGLSSRDGSHIYSKKAQNRGTQWITEFQKPDPKAEPWFMCFMCQQKIQWKSIIDHVTSTAHRFNYLKTAHKDLSKTLFEQIGNSRLGLKHLVDEFSQKVVRMEGYPTEMEVMIELNINTEALKSVMKVKDGSKPTSASTSTIQQKHIDSKAGQNSIPPLLQSTSVIQQPSIPPLIPSITNSQQTGIPSLLSTNISPSQKFQHSSVGGSNQLTGDDSTSSYENIIQRQAEKVLTQQILATGHFPLPGTIVQSQDIMNADYEVLDNGNTNDFQKRSASLERYQDNNKRFKGSTDQFSSEDRYNDDESDIFDKYERGQRSRSPSSRSLRSKDREIDRDRDRSRRSRDRDGRRSRRSRDRDRSRERNPRDRERKGRYPDRQCMTQSPDRSERDRRKRSSSRDRHGRSSSRDRHIRSSSRERRGRYHNDRDDTRDKPRERTQKSRFSDLDSNRTSDTDRDNSQDRTRRTRTSRFSDLEPNDSNVNESDINLQVTSNQNESGRIVRRVSPTGRSRVTLQQDDHLNLDNEVLMTGDYESNNFDDEILEGDGSLTSVVDLNEEFEEIDQDIPNEISANVDIEREFSTNFTNIGRSSSRGVRGSRGQGSFRNFGGLNSGVNELNLMQSQGLIQGGLSGNMNIGMMGMGGGMQAVGDLGSVGRPGLLGEFNRGQSGMSNLGAMGTGQASDFTQNDGMPDPTREEIDQLMQRAKSLMNVIEKMDNNEMVNQTMGAGPSGMMQMNMFNNMGQGLGMPMGQMSNRGLIGGNRGLGMGFRGQRGFRGGTMRGNF